MSGCETIISSAGPMSPTLEGLVLFMKAVLDSEPWKSDLSLHQLPWRDMQAYFIRGGRRQLNIGVLWDDKVVKPAAHVTRALKQVVDRLSASEGFTVTEWEPYQHERGMSILVLHAFPFLYRDFMLKHSDRRNCMRLTVAKRFFKPAKKPASLYIR